MEVKFLSFHWFHMDVQQFVMEIGDADIESLQTQIYTKYQMHRNSLHIDAFIYLLLFLLLLLLLVVTFLVDELLLL